MKRVVILLALSAAAIPSAMVLSAQAVQQPAMPEKAADISGKWHFVYQTDGGERDNEADFKRDGDQVTGKFAKADVKGTFKDGNLDLAFPFDSEEGGMSGTLKMKGKLKDGKLTGDWQFADYGGTFVGTRAD